MHILDFHVDCITFIEKVLTLKINTAVFHFQPQPIKAGVIHVVVPCAIQATAGTKLVGVPQPKPMHRFSPYVQGMFTPRGSRAELVLGGTRQQLLPWQHF